MLTQMIERDKALQDVEQLPWDANEEIVGNFFDIWWSSEGLPSLEKFLREHGVNVID